MKISRPRKWPVVSSPPPSTSSPVVPQPMLVQTEHGMQFVPIASSSLPQSRQVQMPLSPDLLPVQFVHSMPDAALLTNQSLASPYDLSVPAMPSSTAPSFEHAASMQAMVGTSPTSKVFGADASLASQGVVTIGQGAKLAQTAPTLTSQTTVVSATRSTLVSASVVSTTTVRSAAPSVKSAHDTAVVTPRSVPSQLSNVPSITTVTTPKPVRKSRFSVTVVKEAQAVDKPKQASEEPVMPLTVGAVSETLAVKPITTGIASAESLTTPKVIRKGRFKVMTFHDNPATGESATMAPTLELKQRLPSSSTSQESLGNLTQGDSVTSVSSIGVMRQLSDSGVSTTSECSIENRSQSTLDATTASATSQTTRLVAVTPVSVAMTPVSVAMTPVSVAMTPVSLASQPPAGNLQSVVRQEMSMLKQDAKMHVSFPTWVAVSQF